MAVEVEVLLPFGNPGVIVQDDGRNVLLDLNLVEFFVCTDFSALLLGHGIRHAGVPKLSVTVDGAVNDLAWAYGGIDLRATLDRAVVLPVPAWDVQNVGALLLVVLEAELGAATAEVFLAVNSAACTRC